MLAVNLHELELVEERTETDATIGRRVAFPIYAATGAAASAVVYFEVAPGEHLGRHSDSAEEVILVLAGEAEAEVDDERGRLGPGGLAVIPAMAPHDVWNAGQETLRVVGFFAANTLVHRFFEHEPGGAEAVFVHSSRGMEALTATPMAVPAIA